MKLSYQLPAALVGAAIVLAQPQMATALTANAVQQIANQITVLIDGQNPGSGVIIAKRGKTYYVLTAKHVVATEDEYTVVAPDGRRYDLNYRTVRKLPSADLAILQFTSDRKYKVATLASYDYTSEFRNVFVSGFSPANNDTPSVRQFSQGLLISKNFALANTPDPISKGYGLFYTSHTEVGMSGGPVLDTNGRVIGIHGRTDGEEIYDDASKEMLRLKQGFSSGIPVPTLLRLAPRTVQQLALKVEKSPPTKLTAQEAASMATSQTLPEATENYNAIDWANRGNRLYRLEQFSEALAAFERAIRLKPDFYQAWYGRGRVLSTLGWYTEALDSYNQALQIKPNLNIVWRDKGVVLALLSRPEEAVSSFEQAITIKSDDYVAWYLRGNLLRKNLQSYQAALVSYNKAIKIQPSFADAWLGRARTLAQLRRYQEAEVSARRALRLKPNDSKVIEFLHSMVAFRNQG